MSQRGLCSRREADRYIEQGLVLVDGEPTTTLGIRIDPAQTITLATDACQQQGNLVTVLLNKPVGYVSGLPEKGYRAAVTLVTAANRQHPSEATPNRRGLAPAGRLDIDSMGLLVFTQDGRVAKRLVGPQSRIEKEYLIWVAGDVNAAKLARLRHGLCLDDKPLRPAKIDHLKDTPGKTTLLRFTLVEGRKRQIRRMCELLNLRVTRLLRVRIGGVTLGSLAEGKWRRLGADEFF